MSKARALADLRNLLVDLYPTEQSSRRVVDEAGLPHGHVAFQDAAIDNWHAILEEADRHDRVGAVVAVAKGEYDQHAEALEDAYRRYREAPTLPAGPYRRNLALLLVAMALLPMWFYLHLYPLVVRSLAVGALGAGLAAGALAAWKLVGSFFRDALAEEGRSRVEKLLHEPRTTRFLAVAVGVVLALCVTTSSVYLVHDRADLDTVTVTATRGAQDQAPWEPLEVAPGGAVAGRPVFFAWPGAGLRFELESPIDYKLRQPEHRLFPWRRLELRASRDLAPRDLSVIRIAANNLVTTILPDFDLPIEPSTTYSMTVTFGDESRTLDDVRRGFIYLGASKEIVAILQKREKAEEREEALTPCVRPLGSVDQMMPHWRSGSRFLEITPLLDGGQLVVEVREQKSGVLKSRAEVAVDKLKDGIHTLCLIKLFQ